MSARYVISTALVFNSTDPEFLLIEYSGDGDRHGRIVGEFHDIGGAMAYAHERANEKPQLTVIEGGQRSKR